MSNDSNDEVLRSWAKLLNPDTLTQNLLHASLYLTAYEFLRQALIEHLEHFFADAMDPDGRAVTGAEYNQEVLSLHEKGGAFFASGAWFRNQGALTEEDLDRLSLIRSHRNFVAHNLPEVLCSIDKDVNLGLLREMEYMIHKIDNWWLREVEIPTNPAFDDANLDDADLDNASSMRSAMLGLIIEAVSGDDRRLREVYELFRAKYGDA